MSLCQCCDFTPDLMCLQINRRLDMKTIVNEPFWMVQRWLTLVLGHTCSRLTPPPFMTTQECISCRQSVLAVVLPHVNT